MYLPYFGQELESKKKMWMGSWHMSASNIRVQAIRISKQRTRDKKARFKKLRDILEVCEREMNRILLKKLSIGTEN